MIPEEGYSMDQQKCCADNIIDTKKNNSIVGSKNFWMSKLIKEIQFSG